MSRFALLLAPALLLAVLAGCTSPGASVGPSSTPVGSAPASAPSASPETSAPTREVVLGVHGMQVIDGLEAVAYPRDDPAAIVAKLTELFGEPAVTTSAFGDTYAWDGVTVSVSGWATIAFRVAELDGWSLGTAEGIEVGSSRDEVSALSPFDVGYDGDGDGLSDSLGLEPEPEPGTQSLASPGEVGTSYIDARFEGDTVSALIAPAGDWRDV